MLLAAAKPIDRKCCISTLAGQVLVYHKLKYLGHLAWRSYPQCGARLTIRPADVDTQASLLAYGHNHRVLGRECPHHPAQADQRGDDRRGLALILQPAAGLRARHGLSADTHEDQ